MKSPEREAGSWISTFRVLVQFLIFGRERGLQLEWEAYKSAIDIIYLKGLILGLDMKVDIAERSPVERRETLSWLTTGNQDVITSNNLLPFYFISVSLGRTSLVSFRHPTCKHCLSISDFNNGILSFRERQIEIAIGQFLLVEKDVNGFVGRDINDCLFLRPAFRQFQSSISSYTLQTPFVSFDLWQ